MRILINLTMADEMDVEEYKAVLAECGIEAEDDYNGLIVDVDDLDEATEIADDMFLTYEVA